jgi:hypothetical protein
MPSSDPITIPKVIQIVQACNPRTILDVGAGNGRYGFLFREILDWNYGHFDDRTVRIDAVEVEPRYLSPVHEYVYDNVYTGNWLDVTLPIQYDFIFMGDVLEHFAEWQTALFKAKRNAAIVVVVAPNWKGSKAQGTWHGNEHEAHQVELTPALIGGRCLFANSKTFICSFGGDDILGKRDVLL